MIRTSAPAKINLSLKITGKRDDGYHLIHTVMQAVSLRETVELRKTGKSGIDITVIGAALPADESNTAYRAADAFFEQTGVRRFGLAITVKKSVPVGAGLAGGSADAAAVLAALNALGETRLSVADLCRIGERVGADVPFCIAGGTALGTGIGTDLSKLSPIPNCYLVIAKPEESISTAEAYRLIDSVKDLPHADNSMEDAVYSGDIYRVAKGLTNDFDAVTNLPGVENIKRIMKKHGTLGCQMTGSGSAVFAVFNNEAYAERCKNDLMSHYKDVFLCTPDRDGARIES